MENRTLPQSGVEVRLHFSQAGPTLNDCLIRLLRAAGSRKEASS